MAEDDIVPNPYFRENPGRCLYIEGEIEHQLFVRLTRDYHLLRADSSEPITVYISSPGGNLRVFEWIKGLLWTSDQSGERPTIITVVTGLAASAAARLLVFGDYSISYPSALIHCHGTRLQKVDEVTREVADEISSRMEDSNRATADEFIVKVIKNLAFLFDSNRTQIEKLAGEERLNPIIALAHIISSKLDDGGQMIMDEVFEDLEVGDNLNAFLNNDENLAALDGKSGAQEEITLLKLILDFLAEREDWRAAPRISEDFSREIRRLFKARREYLNSLWSNFDGLQDIIPLLLDPDDYARFEEAKENGTIEEFSRTKLGPLVIPLWQLANSISNRLVKGENPLTALDAYWLGLVQEVLGSGLPCPRHMVETSLYDADETEELGGPAAAV